MGRKKRENIFTSITDRKLYKHHSFEIHANALLVLYREDGRLNGNCFVCDVRDVEDVYL